MKLKRIVSLVGLCGVYSVAACSAGYDEPMAFENEEAASEEVGTVSEALLAASCSDEATANGMSSENEACSLSLWQFPIRYENISGWPAAERTQLLNAMADWNGKTGGLATFQELPAGSAATPRVKFEDGGCYSSVGKVTNSVQSVHLKGCGDWTSRHELGHLLGLVHQHKRADRDRYVNVRQDKFCSPVGCGTTPTTNVCGATSAPNCASNQLFYDSVTRCTATSAGSGYQLGAFDFNSVMLYGSGFPAEECCPGNEAGCGMVRRNGTWISGGTSVSDGDASALFELYRAQEGWQIFRPVVRTDPGSTTPLDTRITSTVTVTGSPALARWNTSDLATLARGSDSHIYIKTNTGSGTSFATGSWTDIGGDFSSDPAAVSWAANRLDVVAVGNDGNLFHKWYLNGTWAPSWGSLGKPTAEAISAPAIASWGVDRLDIFVRAGTTLYQKTWSTSGWSGWTNLGTAIQGKPAAVSWGANRIDVVAVGTDSQVYHKPYANGTWFGWGGLGGSVAAGTSPAIASSGANKLNVYVKGSNGRLWHKAWANAWGNFTDLGGMPASSPGAFTQTSGRAHVAIRVNNGSHEGVWHRYWN